MNFTELQKINASLETTDVKGKDYVEVNKRIIGFRELFPEGCIKTEIVSIDNGVCIMQSFVYDSEGKLLSTGTAYEKENSSFINKTSYIENCETSAVGRALGMLGIGIGTSIASAEEVQNAINNQNNPPKDYTEYNKKYAKAIAEKTGLTPEQVLEQAGEGRASSEEVCKLLCEWLRNLGKGMTKFMPED